MNTKMILNVLVQVLILTTTSALAAETFDYSKTSSKKRMDYDADLKVMFEGVNTLDYEYEFEIDFELPKPRPSIGAGPGSGRYPALTPRTSAPEQCLKKLNGIIASRRVIFGSADLGKWPGDVEFECEENGEFESKVRLLLKFLQGSQGAGLIVVPPESLAAALRATGPGGSIMISVKATVRKTEYNDKLEPSQGPLAPLPEDQKERIEKHQQPRKFKIEFGPPKGVELSFGPYLGGIERQEFDQVRNPNYDPMDPNSSEFIIGLSEDSRVTYGVAAYWNSALTKGEKFGISWGVAYTLNNELDTSVNGLLGCFYRPPNENGAGLIQFGLAVGRERDLAAGRVVGNSIGESEEIQTTTKTTVSWFAGYGFRF